MPYPRPIADPLDACGWCGHTRQCHEVRPGHAHAGGGLRPGERGDVDDDCLAAARARGADIRDKPCDRFDGRIREAPGDLCGTCGLSRDWHRRVVRASAGGLTPEQARSVCARFDLDGRRQPPEHPR